MFDGMPEQFYQFLAAATTTSRTTSATPTNNNTTNTTSSSLPLPLSFSLHHHHHHHAAGFPPYSPPPPPPSFDASYHLLQHQPQFRYDVKGETTLNLQPQDGGTHHRLLMSFPEVPWSNDEMLALFRIRSSMDNTWFPDFIWENVSRKLAELGFKRSAEKCKEKFEEETRSFNSSIIHNNNCSNKNNNYRLFGELEELCNNNANNIDEINNRHGDDHQQSPLQCPTLERNDRPQTSLSQGGEFPGGDNNENEDEDKDEDGAEVVGEEKRDGEVLRDDSEEREDIRNDDDNNVEDEQSVGDSERTEESTKRRVMRKRKRQKKFEMFKGFCEKIVNKMMAQQEELHCKILQDMVKRDEEKIAKEEAWKRQEIERLQKELEVRAQEQAISGNRQAKILDILKKFSSSSNIVESHSLKETLDNLMKVPNITLSNSSIVTHDSGSAQIQQPTSPCTTTYDHNNHTSLVSHQTRTNIPSSSSNENLALLSSVRLENSKLTLPMSSSCSMDQASQNPNPLPSQNDSSRLPSSLVSSHQFSRSDNHTSTNAMDHITDFQAQETQNDFKVVVGNHNKDETGRRWPRDEVLALINIRCSLFNNNGGDTLHEKESFSKGPLWERISQKMMELGYKRSAKRCKEKWENINKYFRKTKDLNKKRSIDSRTCPYFHQLSHLYSQGALVGPTDHPINLPDSPENRSMTFPEAHGGSSTPANGATNACQGNEGVVQVPGFDFEF